MLSRPTTDAILEDLAREVREHILPLIDDPAVRVNLEMMEQLLTASAVRAAHEIAWMHDEVVQMIEYAAQVRDHTGDSAVDDALAAYLAGRSDSLHLAAQVENYSLAGEAFGHALTAAVAHQDLLDKGAALVRTRRDAETQIRPGFYFPGRS
ncbi:MAG: hypothetical protein ACR2PK_02110 [Acidimicrobiales bacterium]